VHQANQRGETINTADICASFQEAVADVLVAKTIMAAHKSGVRQIVLTGGVAANKRLRQLMSCRGEKEQFEVFLPPIEFCTDNAAMIALAGYHRLKDMSPADSLDMDVYSRSPL